MISNHSKEALIQERDDPATLESAYYAERRASDTCQLKGGGIAFTGIVAGLALHTIALPLAMALIMGGVTWGMYYCCLSFRHIGRSNHYRRALARASGESHHWYTGWTSPPKETNRMKVLWRRHPLLMSLAVMASVLPWLLVGVLRVLTS